MDRIIKKIIRESLHTSSKTRKKDVLIEQFLSKQITQEELTNLMVRELTSLNEGFGDVLKKITDWFIEKFESLYDSILTIGVKGYLIIQSLFKAIGRFTKKYPTLSKVIGIFLVILVVLIATGVSVKAAVVGGEPPASVIEAAIGIIQSAKSSTNIDPIVLSEAQTYLLAIKTKELTEVSQYSSEAMNFANHAIEQVRDIVKTGDESEKMFLLKMQEIGSKLVSSSVEEIRTFSGASIKVRQSWK